MGARLGRAFARAATALAVLALALATGCGSKSAGSTASTRAAGTATSTVAASSEPKQIRFAKTKFALHAGIAFASFRRYLYKPFKRGAFSHPLSHKAALAKAAAAAVVIVLQVRKAREDAQASPLLRKLLSPLDALTATISGLGTSFKGGRVDAAALNSANSGVESIKQSASAAGVSVSEAARARL
jgi:hypothetical protein